MLECGNMRLSCHYLQLLLVSRLPDVFQFSIFPFYVRGNGSPVATNRRNVVLVLVVGVVVIRCLKY